MEGWERIVVLLSSAFVSSCSLVFSSGEPAHSSSDANQDALETNCQALPELLRSQAYAYYPAEDAPSEPDGYLVNDGSRARNQVANPETGTDAAYQSVDTLLFQQPGLAGFSMQLQAVKGNSQMLVPTDLIDLNGDFTIELAVNIPEEAPVQNHGGLFIMEEPGTVGFRLGTYFGPDAEDETTGNYGIQLWCEESGCSQPKEDTRTNLILPRNQWHHVVMVHFFEKGVRRAQLYVNGDDYVDEVFEMVAEGEPVSQFATGFGGISGKKHTGYLDEMAVYRQALSADEIRRHGMAFQEQLRCMQ